jgi:hypothetical protein
LSTPANERKFKKNKIIKTQQTKPNAPNVGPALDLIQRMHGDLHETND